MKRGTCSSKALAWVIVILALNNAAIAQILLVDDPLQGSTLGFRGGISPSTYGTPGVFVSGAGWQVTQGSDALYYHLPYPVTSGKAEFELKGLLPRELRGGMRDKTELFHMYDYTYQDADNNYGGYRNNPFKMYMRKIGLWDINQPAGNVDKMELLWQIQPGSMEPDSNERPNWDPNTWYKFEVEWHPDGHGNTVLTMKMNGVPFTTSTSFWMENWWKPVGHSIRFGGMHPSYGGPVDGIYRNVKVWQYAPLAPVVVRPISAATYNTRTPTIEWVSEPQTQYQVRVCTSNNPDAGIAWDSGVVTSTSKQITTGTLANLANYYVFVKIKNQADWSPWSASGYWLRVDTSYALPRTGNVSVSGECLHDDGGFFLGLGATYMRGMQRCKYERDRFKRDLSVLAANGFNYVRILSMVSWDQMEIAPVPIQKDGWVLDAWPDYWQQFTDMIDIAYDEYRIRTEITIFADAAMMPDKQQRINHMQAILDHLAGRTHKVILIEVCNEAWQNGFPGAQGIADLREFGQYLGERTGIPVALSAPYDSGSDAAIRELYSGSAADITAVHLSRDVNTFEGGWLPVRDSWRIGSLYPDIPPGNSNEPVGPGYVPGGSEDDPIKLSSAASFAWIAKLPMYVYHSRPGVGGVIRPGFPRAGESITYEESPGIDAYRYLQGILPPDLPNWVRNDGIQASAPFTVYCNGQANKYWTDIPSATDGCHRHIGGIKCMEFVCYPQGIRSGGLTLAARRAMNFTVYHPLTGAVVDTRTLNANQSFILPQGPGAYIIKGTFTGTDATPPGPVASFAANAGDRRVVLTWQNPSDADFWATKIVYRNDRYPSSVSDGTLVCDRMGPAGASDQYTHTGLTNGVDYYYAAFAYDCMPNISTPAQAEAKPLPDLCYSESFTYPNGNLNGSGGWHGSAGPYIRIANNMLAIEGGATTYDAIQTLDCSEPGTGYIRVTVKVRSGVGTMTMWSLRCDDPAGKNLARWYGAGTTARGRIGDSSIVTDTYTLTGGWDTLMVKIYPAANTSEFFFNGTSIGTLDHSSTGAGDTLGRIRFERIDNGSAAGQYLYFDDLKVGEQRIPGDFDGDRDVDQDDFGYLQECLSGEGVDPPSGCRNADLTSDGTVDRLDVLRFSDCMSGAGRVSLCTE